MRWMALALSMGAVFGQPAQVVVVELFTSQGCASCAPADRLARSLEAGSGGTARGKSKSKYARGTPVEVIVLGEHVDYFNTEEWSDVYSSPLFSARQQDYGNALHRAVMYTPQMIVNGQYEVNEIDASKAAQAIGRAARDARASIDLEVTKDGTVALRVGKLPAGSHTADLLLAVTESGLVTKVGGGENKGVSLSHAPVVRSLSRLGEVDPSRAGDYFAEVKVNARPEWVVKNVRLVLLVQDRTTRRILGAAAASVPSLEK